jgi:hypothetical protein
MTNNRSAAARVLFVHRASPPGANAKSAELAPPWPFGFQDRPPVAWWRTMPAFLFGDMQHFTLHMLLENTVLAPTGAWQRAIDGDADAAVRLAWNLPALEITPRTDLVMTALLCAALDGGLKAAMVLAHMLPDAELDHPFGADLANSWNHYPRSRNHYPRRRPLRPVPVGAQTNVSHGRVAARGRK